MQSSHQLNCRCNDCLENANDLLNFIDVGSVKFFEQRIEFALFREYEKRLQKTKFLSTSNGLIGLLLTVPFTVQVKVRSICIMAKDEKTAPPKLRLYNSWYQYQNMKPVQEFDLLPNLQGLQHIKVDSNKFGKVLKLLIHFPNLNKQEIAISYIQIKGESPRISQQRIHASQHAMRAAEESKHLKINKNFHQQVKKEHWKIYMSNIRSEMRYTAGQQFIDKQKNLLIEENFRKVLSAEEMANLDIRWQIFQQNTEFDHEDRRHAMMRINKFILNSKNRSQSFKKLEYEIYELTKEQKIIDITRLKKISSIFFNSKFKGCQIGISQKETGDQLGTIVKILKDSQIVTTYYVKTHSCGLATKYSTAAKIIDPRELMVYKMLQKIGIGCKSYFFGRDLKNLYIATEDAGQEGTYLSYEKLIKLKKNADYQQFFNSENFSNGIFCLDLLSRLLQLTDFQTNPDNFGFVKKSDGWHVKAVDFRVFSKAKDFKIDSGYFTGYLKGNEQVQYNDQTIGNLFNSKQDSLILIAKKIFKNQFKDFNKIAKDSEEEVLNVFEKFFQQKMTEQNDFNMKQGLSSYREGIKHNFNLFCEKLQITEVNKGVEIEERFEQ